MRATRTVSAAQVRSHLTIEMVLNRYGILGALKRKGRQWRGCCPVHGGSNAGQFVVNLETNAWKCFAPECRRGGGALELVAGIEGVSIEEAAARAAEWLGIPPPANHQRRTVMADNRPIYKVFAVEDREQGDDDNNGFWTRIGSAWKHKDGKGLNVVLSALPINGRLVLREFTDEDARQEEERASKRKGARR